MLIYKLVVKFVTSRIPAPKVEPTKIECELHDGQTLNFAGGLRTIHAPGHAAGQVVFLWPKQDGVLFVADAATHNFRLNWSPIYEDFKEGKRTLRKLAEMDYETAVFGHGSPILRGADRQFRARF